MSKASAKDEVGTTMGIAQTFAGISRLIAPLTATTLFQYAGHRSPFIFAAAAVALVTVLAVQVDGDRQVMPSAESPYRIHRPRRFLAVHKIDAKKALAYNKECVLYTQS